MNLKYPQIIIMSFLGVLFLIAAILEMNLINIVNTSLVKFAMNGILVLSLIPMINAGVGMNFGLPVGIVSGLLGMCLAINMKLTGFFGFFISVLLTTPIAIIFGYIYGLILNRVKGKEDIAAIFIGFSFIPLMNFFWTLVPFTNRQMLYPIGGVGLRPKIGLDPYFAKVLDNLFAIKIGGLAIPLGLLGFYTIICLILYWFFKTKLGLVMLAVGENEGFSKLSGVDINRTRLIAVIISNVIAGLGICVYAQSFGFLELYDAPLGIAFPAVSAILIGGSMGKRATIFEAVLGTYLYQTIYLLSAPIANALLLPQMSEILRMIITNGIILYALLKRERRTEA
ncbi:MAG: ABC transporter permease subunit [Bacillota bacterium]|jgi:simple sugar transport system permease protein